MSNLSGNYKINAGEVQGVDIVREQERRARLQLLVIREPSPQPIFGEPVKVELEDETSRRIKNTLGDFTQVLNDKNLLGISRTASSASGHGSSQSGRTVHPSATRRPPVVNGMYNKPSNNNIPKHPVPDKRPSYSRNKPHDSMNCPTSLHSDSRLKDQSQWEKCQPRSMTSAQPSLNGANPGYNNITNPSHCPVPSNLPSNKAYPHYGRNGMLTNTAVQAPRYGESLGSTQPPQPKRSVFRPNTLKLPDRRPEKLVESPKKDQDLETILREMKQAVPPPLTAIQTPRTEESGFPFPDDPKEEIPFNPFPERKTSTFPHKTPDNLPQSLCHNLIEPPPKLKEGNSRQNTPSPLLKKVDNMPVVVLDNSPSSRVDPGKKEPDIYKLGKLPPKTDSYGADPEPMDLNISPFLETEKATELLESLLNESDKCISSSLQEDLEMSESDDDVIEIKSTEASNNLDSSAVEYPKSSPANASGVTPVNSATVNNSTMDVPQSVPSNSSSSESGDSDSDDSSSESNDSDSSASSDDASDAETPSKMWGLSNFFDESRRNHSPATFLPMDTSTNSSTIAVKDDPPVAPQAAKESYSLVDNSANCPVKNPSTDPVPNFLELETSVNIKSEILSPIASPLHPSGPSEPVQPQPPPPLPPPPVPVQNSHAVRGPRTPPSPTFSVTDESVDTNRNNVAGNTKSETLVNVELTVPQSQAVKHTVQQNSCDMKEVGQVQMTIGRKRLSKNKTEIFSPVTDLSPAIQSFENDDEPSASKGLPDVSSDKNENDIVLSTSSYSVPSETSEASHDNYSIKTRQKVSKSSNAKKSKNLNEESLGQSCQKESASKSVGSKFKHPARTRRTSNESKPLSKTLKSSKSDQQEEAKKSLTKHDLKEKISLEKNKNSSKPGGTVKGISKSSVKFKKKPLKTPTKQVTESKKGDVKKKKSKFHIENFLQSPTVSQSESNALSLKASSSVHSPSRDRSPIPDFKSSAESRRRPSVSPSASRSPSRSSSKSVERTKSSEKLRRSTRCSERVFSAAYGESSAGANQDSDLVKKTPKRTPKRRELIDSSPVHVEAASLLSPIPHVSPIPTTLSECAIPTKIVVSIPLDKLTRLPSAIHSLGSEIKPGSSKRTQQISDETLQKKESVVFEKSSKTASNKRDVSKEIKYKSRTDLDSKTTKGSKCAVASKKDKSVKASSEPSSVKSKTSSSVNSKISIKTSESKELWTANETKVSKKRKSEVDNKQPAKRKSKTTYLDTGLDQNKHTSTRTESPISLTPSTSKSKTLERCDSVSSLSSLGSQMSQRSSKEKRSSNTSDAKRSKTSFVKHIKQEKEEKIKTVIKKEPGTPDKSSEKSRDKLQDATCSTKALAVIEPIYNDTSSQYSPWGDSCKDSKRLPLSNQLSCIDWDNSEMKSIKEASNLKHSGLGIMPMDYYYTEGRKQKHLAEKEKDPFVQTLKYFEATVLFILTSQQREEYTKEPESVYQFYRETLNFSKYVSNLILENVRLQQCSPGSMEFKVLVLLLRCQALLHVKLYNLKLKEIKEQQKSVCEFFHLHCQATVKSLTNPVPSNPAMNRMSIPSPHSPSRSPASSVNSQTSGYSSSDVGSCHRNLSPFSPSVPIPQNMLETICRQHTHLTNLHMGHDLWEQADMYMTRSNLREFFREVSDLSENLTLHSSIKDLVNYVQTGISLVKKCCR